MSGEPGYTRWIPNEWRIVAAAATPHINKGKSVLTALTIGQRALPKARRRDPEDLKRTSWGQSCKNYLAEAAKLTPEQLAEIAPPPPPRKKPEPRKSLDEGRDYSRPGHLVKWTTLEKARVARMVKHWLDAGDTRVLSRLFIEAQELVLDADRRRPVGSLQQATTGGKLQAQYEEGLQNIWLIPEDEKLPTDVQQDAEAEAERIEAMAMFDPEQAAATQAARAAEAAQATEATTPPPTPNRTISEAAKVFGETVMGALDDLLRVHTETVLREMYSKLSAMASQTSQEIAAQIERGMRATVHQIVEAELGGPVSTPDDVPASAPAAVPAAATTPEPEPTPAPRALKVDVVGLNNGSMEQRVREAFNGNTDLRFFDPDTKNGYAPHRGRHCVMITQRVPHMLKHKMKAAGVEPIYVKSTAGHVIHAIEELHRSHGVEVH